MILRSWSPLIAATTILIAILTPHRSDAGPIYLNLVTDPVTTAFSGIPAVGGFSGTSTRAGAGTWQLYVLDDQAASFGIALYQISLVGSVPAINHRSPQTYYDTNDDVDFRAGFALVRTINNVNPIGAATEPRG